MKVGLVCLLLLLGVVYVTAQCDYVITSENYVRGPDNVERAYPSGVSKELHLQIAESQEFTHTYLFYKALAVGFIVGAAVVYSLK